MRTMGKPIQAKPHNQVVRGINSHDTDMAKHWFCYTTTIVLGYKMIHGIKCLVDVLGLNATKTLADFSLGPSGETGQQCNIPESGAYTHFLMRMDSMAMNPVVSVGSKPPSSSMEDCFSS